MPVLEYLFELFGHEIKLTFLQIINEETPSKIDSAKESEVTAVEVDAEIVHRARL